MAKVKKSEITEKSLESLKEDVKTKRDELFKARLDHTKRSLKNTTSLTTMRKDIARMLTAMRMQQNKKKEVTNG